MLSRMLRHVFAPPARRWFPADALARIASAIHEAERTHAGEICFAVESALPAGAAWRGVDARQRAEEAFARLRVWDTAANNGVLLYLLMADHRLEIVADRGFNGRVDAAHWREVCAAMEPLLRDGKAEAAVLEGINRLSALVAAHFPQQGDTPDVDELPNAPHVL